MRNLPFKEEGEIRTFLKETDSEELKWHRDREDRTVMPLEDNDWMFQRENQLPEPISGEIRISAGEWHRVIKGTTDLKIRVVKNQSTK